MRIRLETGPVTQSEPAKRRRRFGTVPLPFRPWQAMQIMNCALPSSITAGSIGASAATVGHHHLRRRRRGLLLELLRGRRSGNHLIRLLDRGGLGRQRVARRRCPNTSPGGAWIACRPRLPSRRAAPPGLPHRRPPSRSGRPRPPPRASGRRLPRTSRSPHSATAKIANTPRPPEGGLKRMIGLSRVGSMCGEGPSKKVQVPRKRQRAAGSKQQGSPGDAALPYRPDSCLLGTWSFSLGTSGFDQLERLADSRMRGSRFG